MAIKGVNLGGWLVLEKWMTPSLFEGTPAVDEYTLSQTKEGRNRVRIHHNTFIRETDFKWLRRNDIQAVRIPVGYWIIEKSEPYVSAIERLDWAFRMAEKYNIEVLLCLHGAPGSQNGQDHSGRVGRALWYTRAEYREQTIEILEKLATRYRNNPKFWGIELINEPRIGFLQRKLRKFYREAYSRLVPILRPYTRIVFHDAFTPRLMNAALGGASQKVAMDIHWYHFGFLLHKWAPLGIYWRIVSWHGRLAAALRHWQCIIVGEWSGVISHQALSRYPHVRHDALQYEHITRQLAAYDSANAWFYWTYKTEAPGIWNYRSLVDTPATADLFSRA